MDALQPVFRWFVAHTYALIFLGMIVDATGIPFPGRITLIAAGALASAGGVALPPLIVLAAAGTMLGDHVWYLAGRRGADRLLRLYCRLSLGSRRCVARTEDYFRRYGALTIVLGRFVAGIRIFAWPLASGHGIGYSTFLRWDLVGALGWSAGFILLGYALGDGAVRLLDRHGVPAGIVLTVLAVAALVAPVLLRLRRRRRYGAAVTPRQGGRRRGTMRAA